MSEEEQIAYDKLKLRLIGGHYRTNRPPYILRTFKTDLFAAFGASDNPKREDAYQIAWDYAHSEGARAIAITFEDIVGLIK